MMASAGIGWNLALTVLVVCACGLIWMHWGTAVSMYDLWSRIHAYNHAFLIIPVCLFLAWERRHLLRILRPGPNLIGTLCVALFGAMWLVSDMTDVVIGRQIALVGMTEGLVLATLGWRVFRVLLFPLLYVWLVVPSDYGLLSGLQNVATIASAWGIGLLGIPIFVEGVFIEIPTGRYWVAPGCAGLNFLLSGFALSLLYGEQMYAGWGKRVGCVVVMIIVAIVANWIRIFGLIVAGHYFNEIYDINDHYTEGWVFFAIVVFLMMWIGMRFRDPVRDNATRNEALIGTQAYTAPTALVYYFAVAIVSAVVIFGFPAYATYRQNQPGIAVSASVEFPARVGEWRTSTKSSSWQPSFKGATAQRVQTYIKDGQSVDLFIAYYARQGDGREVAAYGNQVYNGGTWQRLRNGSVSVTLGSDPAIFASTEIKRGERRRIVWHAYWVDERFTSGATKAKLLQAKAELFSGDRRAGYIALSSERTDGTAELATFLKSLPPFRSLISSGAAGG